ncbi:MAG: hypothetical protein ACLRQF_22675 [Thomasclavelia ramosa]
MTSVIAIVSIICSSYFGYVNMKVYKSLNNKTQETVINYSLVSMTDSNIKSFDDLKGKTGP